MCIKKGKLIVYIKRKRSTQWQNATEKLKHQEKTFFPDSYIVNVIGYSRENIQHFFLHNGEIALIDMYEKSKLRIFNKKLRQ